MRHYRFFFVFWLINLYIVCSVYLDWMKRKLMVYWHYSGKNPTDDYLELMMNEAPGPINFTMFLTLFGERLQGTDPEDVIKNAFGCFDEDNNGYINEERLRELLISMGDRFSDEDVSLNNAINVLLNFLPYNTYFRYFQFILHLKKA